MSVAELIEHAVSGLGYEFVDLETSPRGRLLRVFIDAPSGITGMATRARVHRRHQLKTRWVMYLCISAGNENFAVFQRLPQYLQHRTGKFWQLIQIGRAHV